MDLAKIRKKARQGGTSKAAEKPRGETREELPAPIAAPEPSAPQAPLPEPAPQEPRPAPAGPAPETPDEPWLGAEAAPQFEAAEEPPLQAPVKAGRGERLLIFTLDREKYAIPIHDIALIIQDTAITPIPNAPGFLLGILSLRGKIVSIVDAAKRLQLRRRDAAEQGKIIVLDMGADQFGMLVDAIEQLVEVDLSTLEPPPEGFTVLAQDFVEGVFHHKGRAVGFLNLPMFLSFEV